MNLNPVDDNERLARFIDSSRWIRKQDHYVKPAAFMPYPNMELSVSRCLKNFEDFVWALGQLIAQSRQPPRNLYGRADITALDVRNQKLDILPAPENNNPNHANIVNWPEEKEKQKILALELSACAQFVAAPTR